MPEGPSIVILKEQLQQFNGKEILTVTGNSSIDQGRLVNSIITDFKSWGKHFLICFDDFFLRIHFLMWGSYLINDTKEKPVRLHLSFENGFINLYSCSIKIIEGKIDDHYDFTEDVMNTQWDASKAKKKIKNLPEVKICDILLNQNIFSGVGNIIKNEVLYRVRVHPESISGKIPAKKLTEIIDEARKYSFEFYQWKKNYELKKHWLAHTKKVCMRCDLPITLKHTGISNRRSFFCTGCQKLYI